MTDIACRVCCSVDVDDLVALRVRCFTADLAVLVDAAAAVADKTADDLIVELFVGYAYVSV
jgi:hypothetical protein